MAGLSPSDEERLALELGADAAREPEESGAVVAPLALDNDSDSETQKEIARLLGETPSRPNTARKMEIEAEARKSSAKEFATPDEQESSRESGSDDDEEANLPPPKTINLEMFFQRNAQWEEKRKKNLKSLESSTLESQRKWNIPGRKQPSPEKFSIQTFEESFLKREKEYIRKVEQDRRNAQAAMGKMYVRSPTMNERSRAIIREQSIGDFLSRVKADEERKKKLREKDVQDQQRKGQQGKGMSEHSKAITVELVNRMALNEQKRAVKLAKLHQDAEEKERLQTSFRPHLNTKSAELLKETHLDFFERMRQAEEQRRANITKERERIRQLREIADAEACTFAPAISERARTMNRTADETMDYVDFGIKRQADIELWQEEMDRECTFHPNLKYDPEEEKRRERERGVHHHRLSFEGRAKRERAAAENPSPSSSGWLIGGQPLEEASEQPAPAPAQVTPTAKTRTQKRPASRGGWGPPPPKRPPTAPTRPKTRQAKKPAARADDDAWIRPSKPTPPPQQSDEKDDGEKDPAQENNRNQANTSTEEPRDDDKPVDTPRGTGGPLASSTPRPDASASDGGVKDANGARRGDGSGDKSSELGDEPSPVKKSAATPKARDSPAARGKKQPAAKAGAKKAAAKKSAGQDAKKPPIAKAKPAAEPEPSKDALVKAVVEAEKPATREEEVSPPPQENAAAAAASAPVVPTVARPELDTAPATGAAPAGSAETPAATPAANNFEIGSEGVQAPIEALSVPVTSFRGRNWYYRWATNEGPMYYSPIRQMFTSEAPAAEDVVVDSEDLGQSVWFEASGPHNETVYHNPISHEVRVEPPNILDGSVISLHRWFCVYHDPASNQIYYHNPVTGELVWEADDPLNGVTILSSARPIVFEHVSMPDPTGVHTFFYYDPVAQEDTWGAPPPGAQVVTGATDDWTYAVPVEPVSAAPEKQRKPRPEAYFNPTTRETHSTPPSEGGIVVRVARRAHRSALPAEELKRLVYYQHDGETKGDHFYYCPALHMSVRKAAHGARVVPAQREWWYEHRDVGEPGDTRVGFFSPVHRQVRADVPQNAKAVVIVAEDRVEECLALEGEYLATAAARSDALRNVENQISDVNRSRAEAEAQWDARMGTEASASQARRRQLEEELERGVNARARQLAEVEAGTPRTTLHAGVPQQPTNVKCVHPVAQDILNNDGSTTRATRYYLPTTRQMVESPPQGQIVTVPLPLAASRAVFEQVDAGTGAAVTYWDPTFNRFITPPFADDTAVISQHRFVQRYTDASGLPFYMNPLTRECWPSQPDGTTRIESVPTAWYGCAGNGGSDQVAHAYNALTMGLAWGAATSALPGLLGHVLHWTAPAAVWFEYADGSFHCPLTRATVRSAADCGPGARIAAVPVVAVDTPPARLAGGTPLWAAAALTSGVPIDDVWYYTYGATEKNVRWYYCPAAQSSGIDAPPSTAAVVPIQTPAATWFEVPGLGGVQYFHPPSGRVVLSAPLGSTIVAANNTMRVSSLADALERELEMNTSRQRDLLGVMESGLSTSINMNASRLDELARGVDGDLANESTVREALESKIELEARIMSPTGGEDIYGRNLLSPQLESDVESSARRDQQALDALDALLSPRSRAEFRQQRSQIRADHPSDDEGRPTGTPRRKHRHDPPAVVSVTPRGPGTPRPAGSAAATPRKEPEPAVPQVVTSTASTVEPTKAPAPAPATAAPSAARTGLTLPIGGSETPQAAGPSKADAFAAALKNDSSDDEAPRKPALPAPAVESSKPDPPMPDPIGMPPTPSTAGGAPLSKYDQFLADMQQRVAADVASIDALGKGAISPPSGGKSAAALPGGKSPTETKKGNASAAAPFDIEDDGSDINLDDVQLDSVHDSRAYDSDGIYDGADDTASLQGSVSAARLAATRETRAAEPDYDDIDDDLINQLLANEPLDVAPVFPAPPIASASTPLLAGGGGAGAGARGGHSTMYTVDMPSPEGRPTAGRSTAPGVAAASASAVGSSSSNTSVAPLSRTKSAPSVRDSHDDSDDDALVSGLLDAEEPARVTVVRTMAPAPATTATSAAAPQREAERNVELALKRAEELMRGNPPPPRGTSNPTVVSPPGSRASLVSSGSATNLRTSAGPRSQYPMAPSATVYSYTSPPGQTGLRGVVVSPLDSPDRVPSVGSLGGSAHSGQDPLTLSQLGDSSTSPPLGPANGSRSISRYASRGALNVSRSAGTSTIDMIPIGRRHTPPGFNRDVLADIPTLSEFQMPESPAGRSSFGASSSEAHLHVGQRVDVRGFHGTVRYIGTTHKPGLWVGVEMDEAVGFSNGTVHGVRYFDCKDRFGKFVKPSSVKTLPA